eukprot:scaffold40910_cov72-Phaeocystis_antarctica.AAC.2
MPSKGPLALRRREARPEVDGGGCGERRLARDDDPVEEEGVTVHIHMADDAVAVRAKCLEAAEMELLAVGREEDV